MQHTTATQANHPNVVSSAVSALSDTSELYAEYAQRCVDDMDLDDLMNAVKESIEMRLADLPFTESLEEITESVYADDLEQALTSAAQREGVDLSMNDAQSLDSKVRLLADTAFERYEFKGYMVKGIDGWQSTSDAPVLSRIVYLEPVDGDGDLGEDESIRASFTVVISADMSHVVSASALSMPHGYPIGTPFNG